MKNLNTILVEAFAVAGNEMKLNSIEVVDAITNSIGYEHHSDLDKYKSAMNEFLYGTAELVLKSVEQLDAYALCKYEINLNGSKVAEFESRTQYFHIDKQVNGLNQSIERNDRNLAISMVKKTILTQALAGKALTELNKVM